MSEDFAVFVADTDGNGSQEAGVYYNGRFCKFAGTTAAIVA
jgi:hypothetical protein